MFITLGYIITCQTEVPTAMNIQFVVQFIVTPCSGVTGYRMLSKLQGELVHYSTSGPMRSHLSSDTKILRTVILFLKI
jgi:hypothetical protein